MSHCPICEERGLEWVTGELDATATREFEGHLGDHPEHRRGLESLRSIYHQTRRQDQRGPSLETIAAITSAARKAGPRAAPALSTPKRRFTIPAMWVAAASLVLAGGATLWLARARGPSPFDALPRASTRDVERVNATAPAAPPPAAVASEPEPEKLRAEAPAPVAKAASRATNEEQRVAELDGYVAPAAGAVREESVADELEADPRSQGLAAAEGFAAAPAPPAIAASRVDAVIRNAGPDSPLRTRLATLTYLLDYARQASGPERESAAVAAVDLALALDRIDDANQALELIVPGSPARVAAEDRVRRKSGK